MMTSVKLKVTNHKDPICTRCIGVPAQDMTHCTTEGLLKKKWHAVICFSAVWGNAIHYRVEAAIAAEGGPTQY